MVVVLAVVAVSAAGAAELDLSEAAAVSGAVASTQQVRCLVARADLLEWERVEAELASAYRVTLHLERVRHEQRLVGRRIVSAQYAIPLGNARRQHLVQASRQRRVRLEQLHTGD